jgi:hypothetical protein
VKRENKNIKKIKNQSYRKLKLKKEKKRKEQQAKKWRCFFPGLLVLTFSRSGCG